MSTALVAGNMIGSGVFLLPASLAAYGGISLIGWLLTTAGALALALVFSRLSRLLPRTGGPYTYAREGFGDFAGFLVAWGYWISILAGNAAIAVAGVGYLGAFWAPLAQNPVLAAVTALAAIWLLTAVNAAGVRNAGTVQLFTTILKILPLVIIAIAGAFLFHADHFTPFNASGASPFRAITATAALTLWAFLGLESATVPAENVDDPARIIPRATVMGTLLAAVVYIAGTVAVMAIIPPAKLSSSTAPFADAATALWSTGANYAVAAGAAISCFGALNGWILLQGQIPFAAARDGLFPELFSRLSHRGTPVFGLVISSGLVTLLMAMNYTRTLVNLFTFIILLSTMTCLVPYIFASLSEIMILRKQGRHAEMRRPGLIILSVLAFLYSLWTVAGSEQETVFWGFLLLLSSIPVYVSLTTPNRTRTRNRNRNRTRNRNRQNPTP